MRVCRMSQNFKDWQQLQIHLEHTFCRLLICDEISRSQDFEIPCTGEISDIARCCVLAGCSRQLVVGHVLPMSLMACVTSDLVQSAIRTLNCAITHLCSSALYKIGLDSLRMELHLLMLKCLVSMQHRSFCSP